ncbi:hypothetical protein QYF61_007332 [Mycteria americana]|uniref:Uncharacterized protein n=1 Tax=Mycteria americana TaxID=33587 RepID=A0AAN7N8C8_MYCAM|nr:hypothetical protein QYF61_007332 [Mycteria americana]
MRRAAIKQAKRSKHLWYGGQWLKYKYGEAWQIDYITLPQTHQGKRHVLTMVVHIKNMLGKAVWVTPASGKGKPIRGIAFAQGPGCTWWIRTMTSGMVGHLLSDYCIPVCRHQVGDSMEI